MTTSPATRQTRARPAAAPGCGSRRRGPPCWRARCSPSQSGPITFRWPTSAACWRSVLAITEPRRASRRRSSGICAIPRVLLAVIVGAALAASGAVFQASFRNPLVEPYILGVSSGAAFGAALGMVVAAVSALRAGRRVPRRHGGRRRSCTCSRGRRGDAPIVTLVLSGVIVGSVFAAGVSMLKYLAERRGTARHRLLADGRLLLRLVAGCGGRRPRRSPSRWR